jgi:predicted  nucleic acid-binding Zn-ribbon protein
VNADHAAQVRLLDLAAADTALAQLAHRRSHLPQLAALEKCALESADLRNRLLDAQAALDDVDHEQQRVERDIDTVRARTVRDQSRLQAGGLPSRELESLQHEIATLARRQSNLEDDVLEIMQRQEDAAAAVTRLGSELAELDSRTTQLTEERDAALAEIDRVSAARTAERAAITGELPPDLLALYERARQHSGGVGAALLRQRRCEGCHIELSGSELSAVRNAPPDAVVRCENCRRILVRTAESGL